MQFLGKSLFSGVSYAVIHYLCLETGVFWRYSLTKELQARMVTSTTRAGDQRYTYAMENMAMAMTAYVMVVLRGGKPVQWGGPVLMRTDDASAVQSVIKRRGAGGDEGKGVDEGYGGLRSERWVVLSAKARQAGRHEVKYGISKCRSEDFLAKMNNGELPNNYAGAGAAGKKRRMC